MNQETDLVGVKETLTEEEIVKILNIAGHEWADGSSRDGAVWGGPNE